MRISSSLRSNILFAANKDTQLDPNSLTLRLQPNEGIALRFNGGFPAPRWSCVRWSAAQFSYDTEFGAYTPEAYERLLLEAIAATPPCSSGGMRWNRLGHRGLDSQRLDRQALTNREFHLAGTWGPTAADDLLKADGHEWKNPQLQKWGLNFVGFGSGVLRATHHPGLGNGLSFPDFGRVPWRGSCPRPWCCAGLDRICRGQPSQ